MSQTTFGVTYWTNPSHTSRQHILEWGDMRLMDAMTKVLDILKPCFVGLAKLAKTFQPTPALETTSIGHLTKFTDRGRGSGIEARSEF